MLNPPKSINIKMKIFKLTLALFVTTTWAGCNHPLGFFIYETNIMKPLYGKRVSNFSFLVYDDTVAMPTEFSFHDGYAFAKNDSGPEYVGINQSIFLYGTSVPKSQLYLNGSMQIDGQTFFSCLLSDYPIRAIMSKKLHPLCTQVEVYFLPFDRKTGKPVKYWYMPEDNENVLVQYYDTCTSFSDPPYYFLAKVNGKMLPLSSPSSQPGKRVREFIVSRWNMDPTKISYQANYSFTDYGNVGFYHGGLVHGAVRQVPINLDGDKKVQGRQFYACEGLSNDLGNVISLFKSDETCFKVDIYLVQDGLKLYKPNETTFIGPANGSIHAMNSIENRIDSSSLNSDNPLIIYAKVDCNWYILSPFANPNVPNIFFLGLRRRNYIVTKITIQNHYVSTKYGNVGFFHGDLVYGSGIDQTPFRLNTRGKILNQQFYACKGLYNFFGNVISLSNTDQTCFKVEIYLKKFYLNGLNVPWSAIPWLHQPLPSGLHEDTSWSIDADEKYDPVQIQDVEKKCKEMSCLFSDSQPPSVLYVQANDTLIPLSYTPHKLRILTYDKSMPSPTMFTFEYSQIFRTKCYLGIMYSHLVFGYFVRKSLFKLDENLKIYNHRFYSCKYMGSVRIHVDISKYNNCFKVEIYLLPYNKTSGRPVEGSYQLKEGYGWTNNSAFSSSYVYMKLDAGH